jgi:toxin FitB
VTILDTNVLSELMRPSPAEVVGRWVDAQMVTSLYITSITQAEILHGIMLLPRGRRRDAIADAAARMFDSEFDRRILAFGSEAATAYATISAARRRAGHPIAAFDAQIAAIARANGARLATRNVADFAGCDIDVLDPWGS